MTNRDKAREQYLLSCKGQEKSLRDAWEAGAKFERERTRRNIMEGAKKSNMTEPAFATFYGMRVIKTAMVPKGEIWMESEHSMERVKIRHPFFPSSPKLDTK